MQNTAKKRLSSLVVFQMAIRPKTLPAALSPVLLGSAMVPPEQFQWLLLVCALGCALCLQITVNLANDYFDAASGVDSSERLGPQRVTQSGLASALQVRRGIILFIAIAIFFGSVLVWHGGYMLLTAGFCSILAALAYSGGPYPLASHALGEIAVLIFFGWVALIGSYYVHTNSLTWPVFYLATGVGTALAAVMLVNNIRDIDTDRPAGKHTLAVILGPKNARRLYSALLLSLIVWHLLAFWATPSPSKYGIIVLPLAVYLPFAIALSINIQQSFGKQLNPLLAKTALLCLLYSVATSLSVLYL